LAIVLQRLGILPTVTMNSGAVSTPATRVPHIRNFAIWIVVALLLVFLFNLFQGQNGPTRAPAPNNGAPSLEAILINWFPMLLLIGVWIFIMRRMTVKKNDEDPKA